MTRHRWMVFMPFEVTPDDARRMTEPGALPTVAEQPATELARGEAPAPDDPRPWFGLHNVVQDLVAVGCYTCEQPYSDAAEAAGCPGEPSGPGSPAPPQRIGLSAIGRNDPCPCGSGEKYKRCHGG